MFTLEQIGRAHANVKSGADFPSYIREIKALGIDHYITYVKDGHTDFESNEGHTQTSPAGYAAVTINPVPDIPQFRMNLLEHQQGRTSYLQFCELAASNGVANWKVDLQQMTCTYMDAGGKEMLVEQIPA
jgi:uncharacterized protein YbcV (DUF1398 family)